MLTSYFSVYFKLLIALVEYSLRRGAVGIASLAQLPVTAAAGDPATLPPALPCETTTGAQRHGGGIKTLPRRAATAGGLQILSVDACAPLLLGIGISPDIAK